MQYLANGASWAQARLPARTQPLIALGLGTGAAPLAAAGGALLMAACALAGWFVIDVARHRRRRPEAPLVHLSFGLASTATAVALMLAAWAGAGAPSASRYPMVRAAEASGIRSWGRFGPAIDGSTVARSNSMPGSGVPTVAVTAPGRAQNCSNRSVS